MPALDPQSLPRHLDRLYRVARALCGSPHDAEDLVQETCARVLARPRLLRGQDELAYLMTVLRNTFLTQRRTAARRPRIGGAPIDESDPVDPGIGKRPEEALEAREVFDVIASLPERYRLALVAVDIAGLSYREAAVVLETKEATIATRVFRARQQVALRLAGESESESRHGGEPKPDGKSRPALEPPLGGEPGPDREPKPDGKSRPALEPPLGGKPGPDREPKPDGKSSPALEPPLGGKPAPGVGEPEAPLTQREGRPPRRRLMQRGHE